MQLDTSHTYFKFLVEYLASWFSVWALRAETVSWLWLYILQLAAAGIESMCNKYLFNDYSKGFQRSKNTRGLWKSETILISSEQTSFQLGRWGSFFSLNSSRKGETITLLIVLLWVLHRQPLDKSDLISFYCVIIYLSHLPCMLPNL